MNNNPTVHLIQPTTDDHLDALVNREVPSCDENTPATHNDSTDSNQRNRIDKYLLVMNQGVRKKKKKGKKVGDCRIF